MVETSSIKKLKKFDFITKDGNHIHLTEEQIDQKKNIEEKAKAEAAKQEGEVRKEELVDLFGVKVDPLDKLNDLANKKRKHADDSHDYFKANKRFNSAVQYEDHLPGTMINELVLGMIMFNSYHRQDVVTIEDLKDFSNTMLYTVQEILFRSHQGLGLDDHARTFSSLLLAEVDKRNLNPLKQIIVIEQLRRTSTLEMIIEDIQVHHRPDKKDLLDAIYELKNREEGPPDYKIRFWLFIALVKT
nr:hypothetical protein [Tanacetum cinerariifolium]